MKMCRLRNFELKFDVVFSGTTVERVMSAFAILWVREAHEEYGYDHTVEVERGVLIVEAASHAEVIAEVAKYVRAYTNHHEWIRVEQINEYTAGLRTSEPFEAISTLLDPYGTILDKDFHGE